MNWSRSDLQTVEILRLSLTTGGNDVPSSTGLNVCIARSQMRVCKLLLFVNRHGKAGWRSAPAPCSFVKESGGVTVTCLIAFEIAKII